jgi:hypothetical protein
MLPDGHSPAAGFVSSEGKPARPLLHRNLKSVHGTMHVVHLPPSLP